jgi:hypothetical protein
MKSNLELSEDKEAGSESKQIENEVHEYVFPAKCRTN